MGLDVKISDGKGANLRDLPNECPYCHSVITPVFLHGYRFKNLIFCFFMCPNISCSQGFVAEYFESLNHNSYAFRKVLVRSLHKQDFPKTISEVSKAFVQIYNEANAAEQYGLKEICGVGYRKAIEFLVKDYLISLSPDKTEEIKKKFLGACIKEDVSNPQLKAMAQRAVWLGNDEAHYIRVWIDADLEQLKRLIKVTVDWIDLELTTKEFLKEYPDK